MANRSHTLVYYSDVPDSNLDTFRDRHAENSWSFARAKRMERLAFPLPDSISDMTAKEKKKFYFRAFDIATIYTFFAKPASPDLRRKNFTSLQISRLIS